MAKAFKCDICGGFYTWKDNTDNKRDTQNRLMLRRRYPNGNYYDMEEEFDICPDCAKALHNFIKEKGGNHETAEKTNPESEGTAGEERTELERMDVGV